MDEILHVNSLYYYKTSYQEKVIKKILLCKIYICICPQRNAFHRKRNEYNI
jgi:hypothetical protein